MQNHHSPLPGVVGWKRIIPLLAFCLLVLLCKTKAVAEPLPFAIPSEAQITLVRSALVRTTKGDLYFELFPEVAPLHVANFKFLADKGYFRGTTFQPFYDNYIIQNRRGAKLKYSIPPEFSSRKHIRGTLGMARWEDALNPERRSSPSQFYVLRQTAKHMDGNYTSFGILIRGWKVLDSLEDGDSILELKVFIRK